MVQAAIAWDSPSIAELGDLVPTKAEVAVTWVHRGVKVPENPDPVPINSCREDPTVPEFYKLKARFTHDERTGETSRAGACLWAPTPLASGLRGLYQWMH
jgi:hypothetical protein